MNEVKGDKLVSILNQIIEEANKKATLSFMDLQMILNQYGFCVLMIFFAIPCSLPLPGISFVGGMPMIFFAIQMILGHSSPYLPKRILNKQINSATIVKYVSKSIPYFDKISNLNKFRLEIKNIYIVEKIVGFFCLIFSIYITMPVIFGNSLPSIGIIFMCLGLINKDYLLIIIGIISGMIGVTLASGVIFGGINLLKSFLNYF